MATISDRVYGRRRAIELVRELMTREKRGRSLRNRRHPILVVEGFQGTGKTALLSTLVELLDQRVPHARLDFEANSRASVPQVLSALAFDLSRKCPRYGALGFPRFIVGQLVIGLELDLTHHARARRQVVDALKRQRGVAAVREVLADTAGSVLGMVGLPFKPPASVLRLVARWLTEWVPGHRVVLGSFQHWYGHRDLGLRNDPIDVLVDLNRWATDTEDEGNRRRIDELLWTAFLADLRAGFGRRRWADERVMNCAVLLDNADTELATRFLNQLVRARSQRAVGDQDDADPLTVVATSRGTLLADVPLADQARYDFPAADWSRAWWLQYRLPDLTDEEVGRAVIDMALTWGDNQRLSQVVYQLTEGHPASTRLVLGAVAKAPPQRWIEPEAILSQSTGAEQARTVEDQMVDRLLGEASQVAFRDLVTCAAARDREQALALAGQDDMLARGQVDYGEALDPVLWPADGSAGAVLLRRLLRRRLARRDPAVSPSWPAVYARLRALCDDDAGQLYYALAEGDLGFVAGRLHQLLGELDSTAWSGLLASVVEAPHQHRYRQAPIDEVRSRLSSAELDEPLVSVGRLVAALWIAGSPFTDSRRRHLHWQIAADYGEVSQLCPDGPHVVFLEAARRHRREAEWWD